MGLTVALREDGTVALRANLLQRLKMKPGDTLNVVELDGMLVLTRDADTVSELAHEIERDLIQSGASMDEMFAGLRRERERYYQEKYGSGRS